MGLEALWLGLRGQNNPREHVPETVFYLLLAHSVYLIAVWAALKKPLKPHEKRFIWIAAIVFRLTLAPLAPATSDDLYRYRWEGRLQTAGGNPYKVRPSDALWTELRDATFARIPGRDFKAVYGPVVELLQRATYAGAERITSDPEMQTLWMKVPGAAFDIGVMALLPEPARIVWAWSPLVVYEFWGAGHNDSVAVFFVVAAVMLARRARWTPAFVSLGLGVASKLWPLLLLPIFIGWKEWRPIRWWQWMAAVPAIAIPALFYGGPLVENMQVASGFLGGWRNNDSVYGLLLAAAKDIYTAKYAAFAIAVGASLFATWKRWPLERACLFALSALLLVSANVHAWYLTWLLPFAAMQRSLPVLLWTALIPLTYEAAIVWHATQVWPLPSPARWLIYVPVAAFAAARLLTRWPSRLK